MVYLSVVLDGWSRLSHFYIGQVGQDVGLFLKSVCVNIYIKDFYENSINPAQAAQISEHEPPPLPPVVSGAANYRPHHLASRPHSGDPCHYASP